MTTMLLRTSITSAALAALAAAPAEAAPYLDPLQPCYIVAQESQREYVNVFGRQFTPLASVDIYIDEILQDQPKVLFDGTLRGMVRAPYQESGEREFTLRVAEQGAPANTATATSRVTRLSVEQSPERASTRDRVRFRGRGFTMAGVPVYAHYVFAGRSRKTVRLGTPKGPCGTFSVRRKQFPFKKSPREGVWRIQFDQNPRYDPKARVRVPMTIKVRRTIKPQRARPR